MDFEMLFHFIPKPGASCKPFDHYLPVNESMSQGDMILEAQNYLITLASGGSLHQSFAVTSAGAVTTCDSTDYYIDFGPFLAQLA